MSTTATTNPSPKSRFQASKEIIEAHYALLRDPAFQRAEDMALLHYQRILAAGLDPKLPGNELQVRAMINGWKLQGVQEFMAEFLALGDMAPAVQPPGIGRVVNHDVN